jgi:predicted phage terminase large subunit-like protein
LEKSLESLKQQKLNNLEEAIEKELLQRDKQEEARNSLFAFTKYTYKNDGASFLGEDLEGYQVNWHHKVLCDYLDRFLADPVFKRLMVFVPPQYGKSEIVSRRLPAYIFGKNPNTKIITGSYSADLTALMNRDVQKIIDDEKYKELFPDTQLYSKNVRSSARGVYLRNSEVFEIVNNSGYYKGAGVGGGITGWGFDVGIIDDPYKNFEEANSPTIRKTVSNWYKSTFLTRRRSAKRAKIVLIMTRWHEDDLASELMKLEPWVVLNFPGIFEGQEDHTVPEDPRQIGEALWPLKEDIETMDQTKKLLGTYIFTAMYQGKPSPAEGNIFNRSWWKSYRELPDRFDEIIQTWDCAFKDKNNNSYVCGQVWGKLGARKYLLDQVRDRMNFPTTKRAIKTLSAKWPLTYRKYIEDKANGPAVIDDLKEENEISGIIPVEPEGSKIARAHAVSGDVEAGNCYLPDASIAPWIHDFIEECSKFPNSAFNDQVDAMTQGITKLRGSKLVIPPIKPVQKREVNRQW